jgi:hypothetical protein
MRPATKAEVRYATEALRYADELGVKDLLPVGDRTPAAARAFAELFRTAHKQKLSPRLAAILMWSMVMHKSAK